MVQQEFRVQIFRSRNQWEKGGLMYRLDALNEGGITLYHMPTFDRWLPEGIGINNSGGLAVDQCGEIYFINRDTCRLYRYDPKMQRLELITCIGGCGPDPGMFKDPRRMIIDNFTLWILDAGNRRIQAFSRENYQIKKIIDHLKEPVDIGPDKQGNLYILDKKANQSYHILKYEVGGNYFSFGEKNLKEPVGLAVGQENNLYVIDRNYNCFRIFNDRGHF